MATNPYFNNFNNTNEQNLLANLIIEAIRQYGYNFYYLPRRFGNLDDLIKQDDLSYFDTAYIIEMYIKNVEAFEGQGDFLSKFGLEVRDKITLSLARQTFSYLITKKESAIIRPREGDLVYFPMTDKIFEIMYVDKRAQFYPLGSLPLYDIELEVFEYNNERFMTGIAEIDAIQTTYSSDEVPHETFYSNGELIVSANGEPILDDLFNIEEIDPGADNESILSIITANTFLPNVTVFNPFK